MSMGLPNISVVFRARAATVSTRAGQGVVALIILDAAASAQGFHILRAADEIPAALGVENKAYVLQAFAGYINRPARVLLYVLDTAAASYDAALEEFAKQAWDYLAGPPNISPELADDVKEWILAQRDDFDRTYKAVLPNVVADHEAIINFTGTGIKVGSATYDAAGYCSRIAGLIAGTPLTMACTYAPLEEVADVTRLALSDLDDKVDAGELVLLHDGQKVKLGRGVTSLTSASEKSNQLKKIKLAATVDLIKTDLKTLAQDTFIGRYANSYDNKMVLITAIKEYFQELEREGILQKSHTTVEIDVATQRNYLKARGDDVSQMTDAQIRQANTDSHVFVACSIRMLDAIEDIGINIEF